MKTNEEILLDFYNNIRIAAIKIDLFANNVELAVFFARCIFSTFAKQISSNGELCQIHFANDEWSVKYTYDDGSSYIHKMKYEELQNLTVSTQDLEIGGKYLEDFKETFLNDCKIHLIREIEAVFDNIFFIYGFYKVNIENNFYQKNCENLDNKSVLELFDILQQANNLEEKSREIIKSGLSIINENINQLLTTFNKI